MVFDRIRQLGLASLVLLLLQAEAKADEAMAPAHESQAAPIHSEIGLPGVVANLASDVRGHYDLELGADEVYDDFRALDAQILDRRAEGGADDPETSYRLLSRLAALEDRAIAIRRAVAEGEREVPASGFGAREAAREEAERAAAARAEAEARKAAAVAAKRKREAEKRKAEARARAEREESERREASALAQAAEVAARGQLVGSWSKRESVSWQYRRRTNVSPFAKNRVKLVADDSSSSYRIGGCKGTLSLRGEELAAERPRQVFEFRTRKGGKNCPRAGFLEASLASPKALRVRWFDERKNELLSITLDRD